MVRTEREWSASNWQIDISKKGPRDRQDYSTTHGWALAQVIPMTRVEGLEEVKLALKLV